MTTVIDRLIGKLCPEYDENGEFETYGIITNVFHAAEFPGVIVYLNEKRKTNQKLDYNKVLKIMKGEYK